MINIMNLMTIITWLCGWPSALQSNLAFFGFFLSLLSSVLFAATEADSWLSQNEHTLHDQLSSSQQIDEASNKLMSLEERYKAEEQDIFVQSWQRPKQLKGD